MKISCYWGHQVGKTHLAIAMGYEAVRIKVRFTTAAYITSVIRHNLSRAVIKRRFSVE